MKLFSFLKAERSGVTEKEKDKSKPGASVGSGLFDAPTSDEHKAYIPNFLYKPPFGYPLKKNVMMLKELARNPFIFSVIRTLKDEASTSKWEIRLKKEHASSEFTSAHDDDINRVSEFFYKPNGNGESFGELIGQWVQDLCETDAAVGVKVFNKRGEFSQLFARDGSSFLKNPDIYGYMGNRADFVSPMADMNPNLAMPDKIKIYGAQYSTSAAFFQYGWTGNALPVPFGKREIMYIMSNPRSDSIYGRSPMEVIQDVLLTLVYGVRYNMDYFLNGNMPDGIVNLVGADEEVAKSFQDRLKEKFTSPDSLGNRNVRRGHVYPVWGGPEVKFEPFQISSKDMEILEQQKWFTKLVWSAFGVTPDEMGYSEDSNKAVSQTQTGVHKRKALKPLLVKIEYVINTQLMPELDPTGTLEFKFEDYDLDNDLKQHELYEKQINMGIKTAEMVAEEEGIDVERLKKEKEESKQEMLEEQGGSEDDDDWGFDSDDVGIKHKYVRREGSPGNYTYYYKDGSSSKESNENKEIKEKGSFLGVCDRVRQTETGEKFWQEMMKNKKKIDEKEFLKNVDIKKVLDEDESWNEYRDTLEQEQEGEKLEYYKSGDYVYFFKTSGSNGFEFIWSKKPINLKHKYVRREGSPGNYTYYYDEPKSTTNTKTQEANKTIKEYKEYHDNMISELKKSFENRNVYGRVKEKESIIGKLKRKPDTYKSINDIKDISGIRIESATIKDVYKDVEKIKKIYEIENIKDYIKEPQGPYRSIHLIVKKDNKYSEIQIRTKNMTVLGDFMHDKVYKVPEELKGKIIKYQDEINDYLKTFSDYFHHKDGVNTGITEPPPCIEVIKITVGCL